MYHHEAEFMLNFLLRSKDNVMNYHDGGLPVTLENILKLGKTKCKTISSFLFSSSDGS